MPAGDYAAIFERTFEKELVRRFARLGIDARRAWGAS
jgi:hypothetical protein